MTGDRAGESDSGDNETEYYCDIRRLTLYSAHRALIVHGTVRMMVQWQYKTEIATEENSAGNGENIHPFAEAKNG